MSYRTLRVDGRVYQYSIGRRYTHIRGVGTFSHEQIGDTVPSMLNLTTSRDQLCVTPRCVANAIKGVHKPITLVRDVNNHLVDYYLMD